MPNRLHGDYPPASIGAPAPSAIHDRVRGFTPWPGAHTTLEGKLFKLLQTRLGEGPFLTGGDAEPGTVVAIDKERATIACGPGFLALTRGQVAGRKVLGARALAAGRTLAVGTRLGD